MTTQTQTMTKTKISATEFDKKVEIEAAHLEYIERKTKAEAYEQAKEIISQSYEY